MSQLIEQHRKNQQARAQFALMNQTNNSRTQQTWNSPKNQITEHFQSPFQTTSTQFSNLDNCIIHSSQASFLVWRQSPNSRRQQARTLLQTQSSYQKSPTNNGQVFGVTGMPKIRKPKNQGNQTSLDQAYKVKVDPKLKRQLSENSKKNFLHFLLVQKVGHKDEKSFFEFLRNTYNFEPPSDDQNQKLTKKGIPYLQTREESDDKIKKLTTEIFTKQKRKHQMKEPPLDEHVFETCEQQLRRCPKLKEKMDGSLPQFQSHIQ